MVQCASRRHDSTDLPREAVSGDYAAPALAPQVAYGILHLERKKRAKKCETYSLMVVILIWFADFEG